LNIRPETPADYAAINLLHIRAFKGMDGSTVSHMHRQMPHYDPALALVAEQDHQIVGHVLFTPHTIRLLETDVAAVVLSPLGIDPSVHRQGIGGALIQEGHRIAREKGFALSFLLGHDTYYPRFGYRTHAYGSAELMLSVAALPAVDTSVLIALPPAESDTEALVRLWRYEEGRVDFAIAPDAGFLDWLSPNPSIQARVYQREGNLVGYTLMHDARPTKPVVFMAADAHAAQAMAASIGQGHETLTLPLHPYSASTAALGQAQVAAWSAGMVCGFEGDLVDAYFDQVRRGVRVVGRPVWGRPYDLA
jgi:putative acetyltransferase